jgi:hypothetical protein
MDSRSDWPTIMRQTRETWNGFRARFVAAQRQRAATRAVHARCEAAVRGLAIPAPFDASTFCAALAVRRSRPIELLPLSLRGLTDREVLYGVVIDKPSCDIIVYERDTSQLHQQQIILHEASHLILEHHLSLPPSEGSPRLPPTILGDGTIRHLLWRRSHTDAAEQEAEILASLILERAVIGPPMGEERDDAPTMAALERLVSFYRLRKGA